MKKNDRAITPSLWLSSFKRILFGSAPLLLLLVTLVSGCATPNRVSRDEGLQPSFAYVTGKHTDSGGYFFSLQNSDKGFFDLLASFNIFNEDSYSVNRVYPGWYTVTSVNTPSGGSLSGNPLLSVYLEAGKLTYIGDITLDFKEAAGTKNRIPLPTNPPGMASGIPSSRYQSVSGSLMLTVQNNSEAVKNSIRKDHPGLARDLDAIFVYKPAQ